MTLTQLVKNSQLSKSIYNKVILRYYATQADNTPRPVPLPKLSDNFSEGTSISYIEALEEKYRKDPTSVDTSWGSFFKSLDLGVTPEAVAEAYHNYQHGVQSNMSPLSAAAVSNQTIQDSMKLYNLGRAHQVFGHFSSTLDPLGLEKRIPSPELALSFYDFTEQDLDRQFYIGTWKTSTGFLAEDKPVRTLREYYNALQNTYTKNVGWEYMHMPNREMCNWIRDKIEVYQPQEFTKDEKIKILDRLAWAFKFETFLSRKHTTAKRFGVEGAETFIPGMKIMIDEAADSGVDSFVIGMAHRGRLNILGNVVRKPLAQIFGEFQGRKFVGDDGDEDFYGSGDVKYHLGTSYDRPTAGRTGKKIHLSLMANPSHLEAVDTAVLGKVKAKQHFTGDTDKSKHVPLLIHGDGSMSGQGIVYECFDLSDLQNYSVGGCIHVVLNNQIAFTTEPQKSRSSPYCTDVAKTLPSCPIFHVNGDDVEAVSRCMKMAIQYRQTFKKDVVVDIVCYRKFGHNELDEPSFTQPKMYQAIKTHRDAYTQYKEKLMQEGVVDDQAIKDIEANVDKILNAEYENGKTYQPQKKDWLASHWAGFLSPKQLSSIRNTGVRMDHLIKVGEAITTVPEDFHLHKGLQKILQNRRDMLSLEPGKEGMVDWGMAEHLAFGTLLAEGFHVRISGQDSERGTFSHRHSVLHDQENGSTYIPLDHVYAGQEPKQFIASNSNLSEYGILGYELGYSMESPNALVIWEAQFGDFMNGAQIMFDQFISSGEQKWLRQNGLTVLLPHGYDGQGPEHSSGRIERFLQQTDEHPFELPEINEKTWFSGGHLGSQTQRTNWQIVNCSTPANFFHVLRRQVHRQFRKPLVVFTPKNLLRHPDCRSSIIEFDDIPDDLGIQGVRFKRLMMDESQTDRSPHPKTVDNVKRLVLCSGKIYYELNAERSAQNKQNEVHIARIEQLAPFPFDLVIRELRRYPNAEILWCQEEPLNMGAYFHIQPRLETCMNHLGIEMHGHIKYSCRQPSAATATGFGSVHAEEQKDLVKKALDLNY